jgi:hypothetical protein
MVKGHSIIDTNMSSYWMVLVFECPLFGRSLYFHVKLILYKIF